MDISDRLDALLTLGPGMTGDGEMECEEVEGQFDDPEVSIDALI